MRANKGAASCKCRFMRHLLVQVAGKLHLPPGDGLREWCSPDLYAHVAAAHHLVAGLAVERGGERRQVRHGAVGTELARRMRRTEEHTSELQSLMRISYAVFCLHTKQEETNATK